MSDKEHEELQKLVKQSMSPVETELRYDLWPRMRQRLEDDAATRNWWSAVFSKRNLTSVPWFDWAALAVMVVCVCVFPSWIPVWLYNM
ncbi:MAG TPA: hypothetical protein VFO39_11735 [Candidatus Sulfotelmatobacter sp.]|nr:hypothetical protein [Candidatus Sulfotelmatobacter sp.]